MYSQQIKSELSQQDYLLRLKNCELVYNLGVNLLHIGQHREAFETLLKTTALMAKSPHWWLHLAECCIAHNSERKDAFKELVAVPPAASASSKKQRGQQQQGRYISSCFIFSRILETFLETKQKGL